LNWKAAALLFLMIFSLSIVITATVISLKVPNETRQSISEKIILDNGLKPNGDPIPGPWPPGTY
jgi:hypothetical protein